MKKLMLAFILILFVGMVYAQEIDLKYMFRANAHHKFKEHKILTMDVKLDSETETEKNETLVEVEEFVLGPGEKGKVKQTATTLMAKMNDEDIISDASKEDLMATVIFEQENNGKVLALYNEDGTDFEGFDASEEHPIFPDKKVKLGDTWVWERAVEGQSMKFNCTLQKMYSSNGVDIAMIKMDVNDTISIEFDENETVEGTVKGSGVFYYAVNYGNDLYLDYDVTVETQVSVDNGEGIVIPGTIKQNVKYKYWRCE